METEQITSEITSLKLTLIVQKIFGEDSVSIASWQYKPIFGGLEQGNYLFRITGKANVSDVEKPWSVVLKVMSKEFKNPDPDNFRYWKREALGYRSNYFPAFPEGLKAPKCYLVDEQVEKSVWIWIEDLSDDYDHDWPWDIYPQIAYNLGLFNGAYLSQLELPTGSWVNQHWLEKYVEHASPMIDFMRNNPEHPFIKTTYEGLMPLLLALWDMRHHILKQLDKLPQCFNHQDTFRGNIFLKNDECYAIDWGYMGIAPIGTEIVPLIAVSLGLDSHVPSEKLLALEKICLPAYIEGVRQFDKRISRRRIRKCYVITLFYRYIIGGNIGDHLPAYLDESRHEQYELATHKSVKETTEEEPDCTQFYVSRIIEMFFRIGFLNLIMLLSRILYYQIFGVRSSD